MADETREQNHLVMQAGAMRPLKGPAATGALAASGGLELPGGESHPLDIGSGAAPHEMIPGERDPTTLTSREVGALGTANGEELPREPAPWLDEDAAEEARRAGGGDPRDTLDRKHAD